VTPSVETIGALVPIAKSHDDVIDDLMALKNDDVYVVKALHLQSLAGLLFLSASSLSLFCACIDDATPR
jgi:hypothetical protein